MSYNWADSRNFLSKLSARKLKNIAQVYTSFQLTKYKKQAVQWGMPFTLSIEPTTACNLRCPECPSGLRAFSRPTGNLKTDFFRQIVDELYKDLVYLIFYFQGEPYINPDFLNMVNYAHKKGIYTTTSTNAHFINDDAAKKTIESGLDRIIISIDGTTQEVYESYRKAGSLDKVIEGTERLIYWKRKLKSAKPYTIFQFLVVKPNQHQIPDVYKLADKLGVDEVKLKTAQIYDYENGHPLIPTIDKFARYEAQADGRYKLKNELLNQCWKLWHASVVTWDGMVVPCCFDKDATHRMGDLKEQSFKSIWRGPLYNQFRSELINGRDQIDICTNCTEGCKVWA